MEHQFLILHSKWSIIADQILHCEWSTTSNTLLYSQCVSCDTTLRIERLAVKEDGGLGFKKLRNFNVAMLAKQAWRLINNANPLVTQLMRARYFPTSDFLNAKLGENPSFVWRSILESQTVIRQGCRRRIGDGASTNIWKIPWLLCPENGFLSTEMVEELKQVTVQNLLDENGAEWDDNILADILNERDRDLVRQIPLSRRRREDSWFWSLDEKGQFTVRSCYRKLNGEAACPEADFWRRLWNLKLPGKVLNLIWRACRNCLPTAQALVVKRVNVLITCPWCQGCEEDANHVLFQCSFAREVWTAAGVSNLVSVWPNESVLLVLKRVFQMATKEQVMMICMLCWSIWQRRNDWVWNRVATSPFGVRSRANGLFTEWQRAREASAVAKTQHHSIPRTWRKPPRGWVKINVDAACVQGQDQIGMGCVIRDEEGNFIRAKSTAVPGRFQPREAEAIGLKEALAWTKEWRSYRCLFECDAKLLVEAVNGGRGNTYFHAMVEDCRDILKHFNEVLVSFTYRSANMVAHDLARVAYSMSGSVEWLSTAPEFITCIIDSEKY